MAVVPNSLRTWFVFHFAVDISCAVPLLFAPEWSLRILGWETIDPVASRLVAAALIGIGVESYLGRRKSVESYLGMLRLKILWSLSANLGIALSIAQGAPPATWLLQTIFAFFSCVWIYWWKRLKPAATSS